MRRQPTDVEAKLWQLMRLKNMAGYKFRRQHPVKEYILDFYCPAKRLCIELDGGQHADPSMAEHDLQERNDWANLGFASCGFGTMMC
jgi:very-short-patch-repair endonuclease